MDIFQSIQPSRLLTPFVSQYWFLKLQTVAQGTQRALPSGHMGLAINRGGELHSSSENSFLPRSYLFGQTTTYSDLTFFDSLNLIIIVFQPLGAKAFFQIPVNAITGRSLNTCDLNDSMLLELEEKLIDTENDKDCVSLIEIFLLNRLHRLNSYDINRMHSVMHSINNGEFCIQKLAQTACLGYKQFQRIFDENIGLHPKEFLQVNRFSKALHTLQTHPTITLDDLANAYGYYDKSHLIKDFKKLAGYSPSQLSSNFDPYSDYMSLFQTFFIDTNHLSNISTQ